MAGRGTANLDFMAAMTAAIQGVNANLHQLNQQIPDFVTLVNKCRLYEESVEARNASLKSVIQPANSFGPQRNSGQGFGRGRSFNRNRKPYASSSGSQQSYVKLYDKRGFQPGNSSNNNNGNHNSNNDRSSNSRMSSSSVLDRCRGRLSLDTAQKVVFEFRNSESNSDRAVGFSKSKIGRFIISDRLRADNSRARRDRVGSFVFECVSEVEKGKVGIFALGCRLGEGASLGRERSRLGENAQDFELATGGFSLGRECLAWARMPAWARFPTLGRGWPRRCPEKGYVLSRNEIVRPAMPRKESRKPRNESTDRKRLGRGPSRMDSFARRWNYRSVLSQEGTGGNEEERYS
ncbi:unnamed protein product [Lupinus luteus]|uniref:Uncharacterized protein n=1 Tax=Lupinus luteus TaxID=3873 RepID=A0AAV1YJ25_LUPLU